MTRPARAVAPPSKERGPRVPCPRCGTPLTRSERDTPRRIRCPRCRYMIFDYPRACAGMLVVKRGSVLVLRRGERPKRGFLDLPGGFVEAGEGFDAAAMRELREETGLVVPHAEFLGMYWDRYFLKGFGWFPTMNFYFVGRWRSGEPRAADDAAGAEWVPIGQLGTRGARFAWNHMRDVLRDLRRRVAPRS